MKKSNLFRIYLIALALTAGLIREACPAQSDGDIRTREFVIMGYEGLSTDLRSGAGPYLSTLTDLLGLSLDQRDKAIVQVRDLLAAYPNIMDFADKVLAMRVEGGGAPRTPVTPPSGPGVTSGADLENALSHLTRGSPVTVYLRDGEQMKGTFVEYDTHRLWIRGAARRSFQPEDIIAIASPPSR